MPVRPLLLSTLTCAFILAASCHQSRTLAADPPPRGGLPEHFRAVLVRAEQATPDHLAAWKADGCGAVALELTKESAAETRAAARRIQDTGLGVYYWIEVARCPELADRHPEWLASLQGHTEWRRLFPAAPLPGPGEVVKNYPWVPVLYKEAAAAQLERIQRLLRDLPAPAGVFLNDLQGAPSACGCGNPLCRWTADYGPLHTATRLPADGAAQFVAAVAKLAPHAAVVPVWTTECEQEEQHEACSGVSCFPGACWREYSAQLTPVARQCSTVGALCLYRAFHRDQPRYGPEAGWVGHALRSFQEMPPLRGGEAVPAGRLLAVLQGWDVTGAQQQAGRREAQAAGAGGELLALTPISQDWEPRVFRLPL
jgi:hypothetical protein